MAYDGGVSTYDEIRQQYQPEHVRYLLIAESPPPEDFPGGSRHFYRSEPRTADRLFTNTIWALYPEAPQDEPALEKGKEQWLRRLQQDGVYMIESVEESIAKPVKKPERQQRIRAALPRLIERVRKLADDDTVLVLIKSNVFDVAAEPLREAGFTVPQTKLVDYPGHWNQQAYREKLAALVKL